MMKSEVNAIAIVAHPDDETIWMGGTILKNKKWKWTIFSLCRKNDSDRAPKFARVCKIYNAEKIISDLDDEVLEPLLNEEIKEKINEKIGGEKYDYVFTHGENGEYGHIRHREIHRAVKELVADGKLFCRNLYFFSYGMDNHGNVFSADSDFAVELDDENFERKKKTITETYGFGDDSFEARSCCKKEAFVSGK